jgi:hypothetical protein
LKRSHVLKSPGMKNCFILRVENIFLERPPSMHDKIKNKQKLNSHYYRMDRWTGQATMYKECNTGQQERLHVVVRFGSFLKANLASKYKTRIVLKFQPVQANNFAQKITRVFDTYSASNFAS